MRQLIRTMRFKINIDSVEGKKIVNKAVERIMATNYKGFQGNRLRNLNILTDEIRDSTKQA